MNFTEPSSRPLRRRCRFRISGNMEWPSSDGLLWWVARELWWAGYRPTPSTIVYVTCRYCAATAWKHRCARIYTGTDRSRDPPISKTQLSTGVAP